MIRTLHLAASLLLLACAACLAAPAETADRHGAGQPTATSVTYAGRMAFRLSDGRTEAVVVPSLGRVMRYGLVGGENFLWNSRVPSFKPGEWKNWGGDKTWLAPQGDWPAHMKTGWPPDPAQDGMPHLARTLPNGRLQMASPPSVAFGARITREFWFAANGDFLIKQTVAKTGAPPMMVSLWNVTQIPPDIEAVFVPLNANSAYKGNFHWFGDPLPEAEVSIVLPTLLRYRHTYGKAYKIGADSPVSAVAAVKDGLAFVERAPRPDGQYPDGAARAGFPVEVFNGVTKGRGYTEMELLSPLRPMKPGDSFSHTLRWSLHKLTAEGDDAVAAETEALLLEPWVDPGAGVSVQSVP